MMVNHFAIAYNLTWITVLGLLVFVLLKGRRNRLVTGFCLYMINIAAWSFCNSRMVTATNPASGLFWGRALHWGAIIIPISFFHFALAFQTKDYEAKWRPFVWLGYGFAIFFLSVSFSKYFVPYTVQAIGISYYPQPGPLYMPYVIFFVIYVGLAFWTLVHAYKEAVEPKKTQLRYALIAYVVAYAGGAQAFLPVFGLKMSPLSLYGVPVCMCILTYAVFVHRLMDITVIIRKTVIYSAVTGVMAAIMVFVAMLSTHFTEGIVGRQTIALALTACLITVIFHPLQLKIQSFVDQYLFRDWADRPMVREVASGFSHELKSPLAGLSMQAQLAISNLEDFEKVHPSMRKELSNLKGELRYILNQAMDAARRIDAVRGVAEPGRNQTEPVDVPAVIEVALAELHHMLGQSTVAVRRDLAERLPFVQGSAKQLEIVFINLMKNAMEAMDKGNSPHTLTLAASEQNGSVLVSVKDNGEGIAAKDLGRIFELNFTTKGRRGTGMGLYLSHQIIKAHGGTIEARSEEGKGTEFIVSLPKYTSENRPGVQVA